MKSGPRRVDGVRTRSENPSVSTRAIRDYQNFACECNLDRAQSLSTLRVSTSSPNNAAGVLQPCAPPVTAISSLAAAAERVSARAEMTRNTHGRTHTHVAMDSQPRGRSRCTSPHGAPRNKSRGRADRTLVLGCCGAAAQNAGSRPGLPLIAPDTRRFQPTPHGRRTRPPPREKKNFDKPPQGRRKAHNLAQGFGRPAMGA